LDSIKSDGLGYGSYVSNFDRLFSALGINESIALPEMQRLIDHVSRDQYQTELTDFLAKQSKHKKGNQERLKQGYGIECGRV